jgi:site-specific DNA recombinase
VKLAAIYVRVASKRQSEDPAIASQTAAVVEFARRNELYVPDELIVEDAGYSGVTLDRPGLERLRDIVSDGQIKTVVVYTPDRLSRSCAHQILLMEEFARNGVETRFVRVPHGDTPEGQLLVRFQGMIAEYERVQIMERSRRGK